MSEEDIQELDRIQDAEKPADEKPDPEQEAASPREIFLHYSVLMETALTASKMILLFTAFLTVFLSWLAGAAPVWVAARGVAATVAMGLMLWFANWIFTQRVMDTVMAEVGPIQEQAQAAAPVSTVEKRA